MKRVLLLLALACICAAQAKGLAPRPPPTLAGLPRSEVQVLTARGPHLFKVWIADNDPSRQQGLMFIKDLPADQGMLFLFDRPGFMAFWMKNTYLSLDLVFIARDGIVVNVAQNATPLSEQLIESAAPVTGVLELVAGTAARIGLSAGDRISHPAFAVQKPQ